VRQDGRKTASMRFRISVSAMLVVALTFLGHLIYGAKRDDLSLAFSIAWLIALPLMLTQEWARKSLDRTPLIWPGASFALVILAGIASLTPLFEPHPIWSLVPGAIKTVTIDPYATWLNLFKLLGLAAAFLVGAGFGGDDERAKQLIRTILLAGLAYGTWAFLSQELDRNTLFGQTRVWSPDRLSASLPSANIAATLFGALTVLNLADLLRRFDQQRERRTGRLQWRHLEAILQAVWLPLLGITVSVACLVLTVSRSGMAATVAGIVLFLGIRAVVSAKTGAWVAPLMGTLVVVLGLLIGFVALNLSALDERVAGLGDDAHTRATIFAAHWAAFLASPWQGFGLGTFAQINAMYVNDANRDSLYDITATYDVYLHWLEEAGLVGTIPMFATVLVVAVRIARGVVERQRSRLSLLGILCVLALFLIHGATDYPFEIPSMSLFLSLLLGVGYRMAKR